MDPFGFKSGPSAEFFDKLNKGIDKAPDFYDEQKKQLGKSIKKHTTPLAVGGGVLGAGMLYKNIRNAQKNKLEREKLKAEKQYYDNLNKEKTSAPNLNISPGMKSTAKDVLKKGLVGAGGAIATKGAIDLYNKAKNKMNGKTNKYWQKFIEKYPEYKDKPEAKEYFELMVDTSPDLAKHPVAAKSFLKSTFGLTGDVNFNNLRDISNVQRSFNNRSNAGYQAVKGIMNKTKGITNDLVDAEYTNRLKSLNNELQEENQEQQAAIKELARRAKQRGN